MSDPWASVPDEVRYYVEPWTGVPTEERTFFAEGGAVLVSQPMPKGAVEITKAKWLDLRTANAKEVEADNLGVIESIMNPEGQPHE